MFCIHVREKNVSGSNKLGKAPYMNVEVIKQGERIYNSLMCTTAKILSGESFSISSFTFSTTSD